MAAGTHIIKKQILELELSSRLQSWEWQEAYKRLYYDEILPRLEAICDELDKPGLHIRLDSLELDAGTVKPADFPELAERVTRQFEHQLRQALKDPTETKAQQLEVVASQMELARHYLQYGNLPWYSDNLLTVPATELVLQLAQSQSKALFNWLQPRLAQETVVQRIAWQLPATFTTRLLQALMPAFAERLQKLLTHWEQLITTLTLYQPALKTRTDNKQVPLLTLLPLLARSGSQQEAQLLHDWTEAMVQTLAAVQQHSLAQQRDQLNDLLQNPDLHAGTDLREQLQWWLRQKEAGQRSPSPAAEQKAPQGTPAGNQATDSKPGIEEQSDRATDPAATEEEETPVHDLQADPHAAHEKIATQPTSGARQAGPATSKQAGQKQKQGKDTESSQEPTSNPAADQPQVPAGHHDTPSQSPGAAEDQNPQQGIDQQQIKPQDADKTSDATAPSGTTSELSPSGDPKDQQSAESADELQQPNSGQHSKQDTVSAGTVQEDSSTDVAAKKAEKQAGADIAQDKGKVSPPPAIEQEASAAPSKDQQPNQAPEKRSETEDQAHPESTTETDKQATAEEKTAKIADEGNAIEDQGEPIAKQAIPAGAEANIKQPAQDRDLDQDQDKAHTTPKIWRHSPEGGKATPAKPDQAEDPRAREAARRQAIRAAEQAQQAQRRQQQQTEEGRPVKPAQSHEDRYRQLAGKAPEQQEEIEEIYLHNAGLILLNPFIGFAFKALGYSNGKEILGEEAASGAVHFLQYLVTGSTTPAEEHELALNKLLAGLSVQDSILPAPQVTEAQQQEVDKMIKSALKYWTALKTDSIDSLRYNFLMRNGALRKVDEGWELHVEQKAYDVIMDSLPWSLAMVKQPWMNEMIHVVW